MPPQSDDNLHLEIGHVLFIDIVGYSKLLIEEQKERLNQLTEIVLATKTVREATDEQLVRLPTGDGMALVFRHSAEEPARCALEIAQALQKHPELPVRMGIHSGPVSEVTDVSGRTNIAGAGVNMAQRVMDCGDAGHILLSQHVADDLEHYLRWQPWFHPLGECRVKHGVRVRVTNLYDEAVGNRALPKKFRTIKRRRWQGLIAALLFLAALLAAAQFAFRRSRERITSIPETSVAVLPFENLSEDKGNAYFAAGIQDEILTRLSGLRDLKVISRSSTEHYQSRPPNLKIVGQELGVANILEGSVQKIANAVHINVQLIKASTDSHLWAQSYDRTLENVFGVQGEVAQMVARSLEVALAPKQIEKLNALPTQNPQAYDSYLRGDYALNQAWKDPGDYQSAFEPAVENFQKAIAADPNFALAFARLADAQLTKYYFGHLDGGMAYNRDLLDSAKQNIDRALQLEPDLAEAHVVFGRWHRSAEKNDAAALAEYEKALKENPRLSETFLNSAFVFRDRGDYDKAIDLLKKALEFDPRNFHILRNLAVIYTEKRNYKEAYEIDSRIVAMDPADEVDAGNFSIDLIEVTGDVQAALRVLDDVSAHLPAGQARSESINSLKLTYLMWGRDFATAKKFADSLPPGIWRPEWERPMDVGDIEDHLGQKEEAHASFQEAQVLLKAAIAQDPKESDAHADLALVDAKLGLKEEALREAHTVIDLNPKAESPLLNLASVDAAVGRTDEAIDLLEKIFATSGTGELISPRRLKLESGWEPLWGNPRFEKLAAGNIPSPVQSKP